MAAGLGIVFGWGRRPAGLAGAGNGPVGVAAAALVWPLLPLAWRLRFLLLAGGGLLALLAGGCSYLMTPTPARPPEQVYAPLDSPYGHKTPQPVASVFGPGPEPLSFNSGREAGSGLAGADSVGTDSGGGEGSDGAGSDLTESAPTGTPAPAPTATPELRPQAGPPGPAAQFIELPEGWVQWSCDQQLRRELEAWAGDVEDFDVVLVSELAEQVAARADCLAQGWAPEFDFHSGCAGIYRSIDGVEISPELRRLRFETKDPFWGPTARDSGGNMVVHFRKLPREEVSGCWYYYASDLTWLWSGPDPAGPGRREGREPYPFPECDYMLRRHLAGFDGLEFGVADAARLMDRVRTDHPAQCGHAAWNAFPQREPREICEPQLDTGFDSTGELLALNWHPDYPARDGSVCWVLERAEGVWHDYYWGDDSGN